MSSGTINLITPLKRKQAAGLVVSDGITVSCAWPITTDPAPDVSRTPIHFMTGTGEGYSLDSDPTEEQGSGDFIGLAYHGYTVTTVTAVPLGAVTLRVPPSTAVRLGRWRCAGRGGGPSASRSSRSRRPIAGQAGDRGVVHRMDGVQAEAEGFPEEGERGVEIPGSAESLRRSVQSCFSYSASPTLPVLLCQSYSASLATACCTTRSAVAQIMRFQSYSSP